MECIQGRGWTIFNGNIRGDKEGDFTYTRGKGETVIDYVIGDQEVRENVEKMEIGDNVESDHHPIVVWIKGQEREKKERRGEIIRNREIWNEEGKKKFRNMIGKIEIGRGTVEEEIEEAMARIREVIKEDEKGERERGKKVKGWWDEECREKKKEKKKGTEKIEEGKRGRR